MKTLLNFFLLMIVSWLLMACTQSFTTPTPTPTPNAITQGREVFLRVCAACHAQNAEAYANELGAPALNHSEHAWHHPDQQIRDWIKNGKLGLGRQMPALGGQLTDEEIDAVIVYLHSLWTPEQLETQQNLTSRYKTP